MAAHTLKVGELTEYILSEIPYLFRVKNKLKDVLSSSENGKYDDLDVKCAYDMFKYIIESGVIKSYHTTLEEFKTSAKLSSLSSIEYTAIISMQKLKNFEKSWDYILKPSFKQTQMKHDLNELHDFIAKELLNASLFEDIQYEYSDLTNPPAF